MTSPQPSTSSARQNNDVPHDGAVMMDTTQITFNFGGRTYDAEKPVETFWLDRDPITQERFDVPAPQYRACIPVYDRDSGELVEFLP